MRVVMMIQNFFPVIGGAEKQALELSAGLAARGNSVDVLTMSQPGSPKTEQIRGVSVLRLFTFGTGLFRALVFAFMSAVRLVLSSHRYDVLHVHLASSHSIFPAVWGRLAGKRVVVKLGGGFGIGELALSRRSWFGRIKIRILGWARPDFIVVNEEQREELRRSGLSDANVAFIPNGVDLTRFHPVPLEEKQRMRRKLAMDGLIFLFVGRFAADKLRLDIFERFVEAWSHVRKTAGDISLIMVGQGPLEADYKRMIARLNLESSIIFTGPTQKVDEFMRAADVFVLPSITEGLSNALLEALGCGLAVCGSRVSGIVDIVHEGKQGFLFDPMSSEDIERALSLILNGRGRLEEMKPACVETARRYSIDRTVEKTLALYQGEAA